MALLRKAYSVKIWRMIKKINNVREDLGRKTDSNFDFSQAA